MISLSFDYGLNLLVGSAALRTGWRPARSQTVLMSCKYHEYQIWFHLNVTQMKSDLVFLRRMPQNLPLTLVHSCLWWDLPALRAASEYPRTSCPNNSPLGAVPRPGITSYFLTYFQTSSKACLLFNVFVEKAVPLLPICFFLLRASKNRFSFSSPWRSLTILQR